MPFFSIHHDIVDSLFLDLSFHSLNTTTIVVVTTTPPLWLLDSGVSHHITIDLGHLSLHSRHTNSDDLLIGDGMGLLITHNSSTTLTSPTISTFTLNNIRYVPNMTKNLISVFQFLY